MDLRFLSFCILMLEASCTVSSGRDDAVPGALVVDRIERQLGGRPCIGALDRWERHYEYALDPQSIRPGSTELRANRDTIHFTFMEAGRYEFRSRRVIEAGPAGNIDDRPMRYMMGEYHVTSDRIFVHFCGGNTDPPPQSMRDSFNAARDAP